MPTNPHPAQDDVLRQALEALEVFAACAPKHSAAEGGQKDSLDVKSLWLDDALDLTAGDFRRARAAASAVREAMKHPASEPPVDTVKSEADGYEPDPAALRSEEDERLLREEIARVIDPKSWVQLDQAYAVDAAKLRDPLARLSLSKADQIIALMKGNGDG